MSFFRKNNNLDLGEVPIESIFINDFLPMANGTYVKVYLLGYKYAFDLTDVTNQMLATHLNIPLSDVIKAWEFWEGKNIIKIHNKDSNDFDIEFYSLRQLYIENNYSTNKAKITPDDKYMRNQDFLLEMNENDEVRKMFRSINDIISREMQPNEQLKILNVLQRYVMEPKVIVQAFRFSVEKKKKKNLNYIMAIIRNWYDDGIITFKDLENHFIKNSSRYGLYSEIYKALGYSSSLVSAGDKEIIDKWIDQYTFDKEFIVEIIKFASKKTSNVNMNYIDKFVTDAYKNEFKTIEEFQTQAKKETKVKKTNNNKFHNFKSSDTNYTETELNKLLGIDE